MFIIATEAEIDKLDECCHEIMCNDCLFNKMDLRHMREKRIYRV